MIVVMVNGIPNSSIKNRSIMMIANIHVGTVRSVGAVWCVGNVGSEGPVRTARDVENETITAKIHEHSQHNGATVS